VRRRFRGVLTYLNGLAGGGCARIRTLEPRQLLARYPRLLSTRVHAGILDIWWTRTTSGAVNRRRLERQFRTELSLPPFKVVRVLPTGEGSEPAYQVQWLLEPYAEPSSPLAAIPITRSKIARAHAYSCGFETLRTSV
jgi:hypothetical protein